MREKTTLDCIFDTFGEASHPALKHPPNLPIQGMKNPTTYVYIQVKIGISNKKEVEGAPNNGHVQKW